MQRVKAILDGMTTVTAYVAGACIVLMMIHIAIDVVMRAFLNLPLTGTIAFVANYYMVFLVCLPLAFVERQDGHITVDVATSNLPAAWRKHLYGWTFLFTAAVFGVSAYATWIEAMSKYRIGAFLIEKDLAISIWVGYFALPLGYALLCLYLVLRFALYLTGQTFVPYRPDGEDELAEAFHD